MSATENQERLCLEAEAIGEFNALVNDMYEAIESLRTATATFPDFNTTSAGGMNPALTVEAFLGLFSKRVNRLYFVVTGTDEDEAGGA